MKNKYLLLSILNFLSLAGSELNQEDLDLLQGARH